MDQNYPNRVVHYLSKDSLVASLWTSILIVNEGVAATLASPPEFETLKSAGWKAVRGANTGDFVCVDNYGGVYRFHSDRFTREVAPASTFQGAGNPGFSSVVIAPDGRIYGIHNLERPDSSTIYQLLPQ